MQLQRKKTRVVVLMDMPLFPYRIYAYNELVKRGYELTVVSVSNKEEKYKIPLLFNHIRLCCNKKLGFMFIKNYSSLHFEDYDYIIVTPNLRVLNYYPMLFGHKYDKKLMAWGHMKGCTAGNPIAARLRIPIFRKMQALIFYEAGTCDEFANKGFSREKMFVANNTQYVDPSTVKRNEERDSFLYVGRIQERKGVDLALRAFANIKRKSNDENLRFVIVGGGEDAGLRRVVTEEGLGNSVEFKGPIHDQAKLGEVFSHALAYVSPGHVGLGVLHSLASGVPVITCTGRKHSVEITNCKPENSLLVPFTVNDLTQAMSLLYEDKAMQKRMSEAAYQFYQEYCTIDKMVDGIDDALKYVKQLNR